MTGGWTLAQLCQATGLTPEAVRDHVAARRLPPPSTFLVSGPRWAAGTSLGHATDDPASTGHRDRNIRELLDEVRFWHWEHGSTDIRQADRGRHLPVQTSKPSDPRPTFPLGMRVTAVRMAHRRGELPPHVINAFEAIPGWTWDPRVSEWNERWADVVSRWPSKLTADDHAWIRVQRRRWDELDEQRRQQLLDHPGLIEAINPSRVDYFVAAVEKWMRDTESLSAARIPYRATVLLDGAPYPVGKRVTYYRRRYRGLEGRGKHPLDAEERALIESLPGWTWSMSETHVEAARKKPAKGSRRRHAH